MRLTDEQIMDIKEYLNRSIKITISSLIPRISKHGLDLIDTIEALQQENEQLRAQLDEWKYEVKCHMDEVVARNKEIEKLRAQVARMRETLKEIFELLEEHEPIWYLRKHYNLITATLSDTPTDYHNPADVEVLRKAREVLEGVNVARCPYCWGKETHSDKCEISKALAEIDMVIGEKEDV